MHSCLPADCHSTGVQELLTASLKATEGVKGDKGSQIEQLQLGLQKQINVSLALQDLYTRSHQHHHQLP